MEISSGWTQETWVLLVLTGGLGESFPSSEPHRQTLIYL